MSAQRAHNRTIVAKLGSSSLLNEQGALDKSFIDVLAQQVAELHDEGWRVVIVSSGAAACGFERLGFTSRPSDISSLQACCSAGQALLTETYAEALASHGIACAQVLLTRNDIVQRESYLSARATLERLLELGAVPVVNENDTVSTAEISFGDNDTLGAIVATLLDAELYVIMSDVEGLFDDDPHTNKDAKLLHEVARVEPQLFEQARGSNSTYGTGGMVTKLRAARSVSAAGIPMYICQGRAERVLVRAAHGEQVGTYFAAREGSANSRKLWIGLAGIAKGSLHIDDGAYKALLEDGSSLLPVGVSSCEGDFKAGDVVSVYTSDNNLVGRGIVRYDSDEIARIAGLQLEVIARFLPDRAGQPCIHRDELMLF